MTSASVVSSMSGILSNRSDMAAPFFSPITTHNNLGYICGSN